MAAVESHHRGKGRVEKSSAVKPGQGGHAVVVKGVGQRPGGLDQHPGMILSQPPCGLLHRAAVGGTGPVFAEAAAPVRSAHVPHFRQGDGGGQVHRSHMGKPVLSGQGNKIGHCCKSP